MTTELTAPGTSTESRTELRQPERMHHYNFYTQDHEATRHFYEDIAGLTLRTFWIEPVPPGSGSEFIGHAFYGMADGGMMAFMQYTEASVQATMVGTEQPMSAHVAVKVDDEQQAEIRKRVEEGGFEHFYIDHGVLRSLYVWDPNRLLVEFAVDPDGYEEMYVLEAERARATMKRFLAGDHTPTAPAKR